MTISFHGKKKRVFLAAALFAVAVIIVLFVRTAGAAGGISAGSNSDRVRFLQQCGWQVENEPIAAREVQIPAQFSKVYQNYSQLNQQAGFDLTKVAGKTCQQYVYRVKNYTGNPDVRATLLVYKGEIAGGDVSTAALNGFMKPLRQKS
ncbi:MAG: DUF4830 domain-containing protein [Oscillospiraceae bacterium]|nr:DUF4830 domain-containing protein [Oscillospiraceae bacterium]